MSEESHPVSEFKSKSGITRVFSALLYSMDGLRTAWRYEHAFRQELMVVVPGVVVALLIPVTTLERVVLIAVLLLVLIVELLNSAIEAVVDRVSLERNPLSKNAKDLGSAAVMISMLLAAVTWSLITLPLLRK
jgi:diacylglycerol kinase (ATP)